ncbi:hypothetical protein IHQ72_24185 [Mesorhizobium onobrychidis]|uniref:Uncharacterized protein n=1 Tax=Mesorhizobium onobrychidis TaxID=2775404 RepID=A0ABY5QSS1_9HYPH|nr:hypothetical protein [Mesorhizobium onobrychidis]UVC13777.1 hypothetical protein IHQ72_24185 [Mesorhizobium onobrychidis]
MSRSGVLRFGAWYFATSLDLVDVNRHQRSQFNRHLAALLVYACDLAGKSAAAGRRAEVWKSFARRSKLMSAKPTDTRIRLHHLSAVGALLLEYRAEGDSWSRDWHLDRVLGGWWPPVTKRQHEKTRKQRRNQDRQQEPTEGAAIAFAGCDPDDG